MTYSFGPFRYDAVQRLLFRNGEPVPLAPKTVETLHILLERRGRIVEKPELMKLLWPDTHVEDVGLARNISLLRKVLGDESEENPFIVTVPRRGYRFAAEVGTDQPAAAPPAPRAQRKRWILAAACAVVLAGAVYFQFYVPSRFARGADATAFLAVVPFECLCPGMDGEGISQGLNEVLVAELSKLPGVQVMSPSSVRRYQRARVSMSLMARLMGLEVLVEGTIQKLDQQLRITTRLVDVRTGRVIWSRSYDEPAADPGRAQLAVAASAAAEVGKRLARR